ncbi:hypothetical protein GCM10011402_36750 [Paracoccus acridae]|uniref:Uncharacterized protein n=1 Tax=Paracoccus acridae TaxID=1795310 RepID=A0ABQ1VMA2_9RHOB|nr:hypothetical protein GCM10011402_36750 [Paracoccus acridae]
MKFSAPYGRWKKQSNFGTAALKVARFVRNRQQSRRPCYTPGTRLETRETLPAAEVAFGLARPPNVEMAQTEEQPFDIIGEATKPAARAGPSANQMLFGIYVLS